MHNFVKHLFKNTFSVYVCVIYMYDAFILCHTTSPLFTNDEPIHMVTAQGSRHQQVVFFPTMWTADVFVFQNTKDLIFLNSQETGRRYKWPRMSEINMSGMLPGKRMTNALPVLDRTGGGCKMTNFVREVKAGGGRPAPATVTVRPPSHCSTRAGEAWVLGHPNPPGRDFAPNSSRQGEAPGQPSIRGNTNREIRKRLGKLPEKQRKRSGNLWKVLGEALELDEASWPWLGTARPRPVDCVINKSINPLILIRFKPHE